VVGSGFNKISITDKERKMRSGVCAAVLFLISIAAYAGDCESLIGLSKVVTTTTSDKTALANFCNEYRSHHADSSSHNFGASYKFLSASYGSSGASVDDVASRYCSAGADLSARADAYKQYVEAIAPGAYEAYESCVANTGKDLVFSLNEGSILPTDFMLTASFKSSIVGVMSVNVEASSSSGVACKWNGTNSSKKSLPSGGSAILTCSRKDQSRKSSVTVVGTSIASAPPVVMPWKAYDKDGNPKDTIVSMAEQIRKLQASLVSSVVAFASDSCPQGWVEYKEAYGLFIRGIDKSGNNIDPSGLRKVGDPMQPDVVGPHTHTARMKLGAEPLDGGARSGEAAGGHGATAPHWTSDYLIMSNGGAETRPKNIALLYCRRP
jgi:hypothetical protein